MAASKIKKGDKVVVLSGKDKGRTGEVVKAMPKEGKVIVSGVNVHARHRSRPSLTRRAGSSARKRRCTFRRSRLRPPTASRPASASKNVTARRSVSRPRPES